MKFGETIESQKKSNPEWAQYYFDYVSLVQLLEDYQKEQEVQQNNNNNNNDDASYASSANISINTTSQLSILNYPSQQHYITTELLVQLHVQLEKIVMFILQQQGIIATNIIQIRNEVRQRGMITTMSNIGTPNTNTTASILQQYNTTSNIPRPPLPTQLVVDTNRSSDSSTTTISANNNNMIPSYPTVQTTSSTSMDVVGTSFASTSSSTVDNMEEIVQQYEDQYTTIGYHLLQLYQFIDHNVTAIRKILKKHDKIVYSTHTKSRKHHANRLSAILLNHQPPTLGGGSGIGTSGLINTTPTITHKGSDSNNKGTNGIHTVIPWSPRTNTTKHGYGMSINNSNSSNTNNHIYTRRKISAEAFGNALLQPLLHDEGLTAITATLEIGLQELYYYFLPQSISKHHTRNSSDASLDFLWDNNNNFINYNSTTSNYYGSINDPITPTKMDNAITNQSSVAPLPPTGPIRLPPKNAPPPTPTPLRPAPQFAQSARVQSRKAFHRPSLSGTMRSSSVATSLGNNINNNSMNQPMTIPGLSNIDSLLIQIQVARKKLQQTNGYIRLLAAPMMMDTLDNVDERTGMGDGVIRDGVRIGDEEQMVEALIIDEDEIQHQQSQINISNILNLCSSLLYMCNYYIVAPTSASYAKRLGGKESLASLIIGMTPVAALISTVLFSWWTNHSYKHALIFASACSVLGNLLYSLALPFDSITLVMVGRLLNGFGSARSINRRYICDTFPRSERTAASAAFVTASAMGMAAGPAIASILHYITTDENDEDIIHTLYWQSVNAPGWFMVFVWTIFLIALIVYFEDPPLKKQEAAMRKAAKQLELKNVDKERESLLRNSITESNRSMAPVKEEVDDVTNSTTEKEPPIWRNVPVMITFLTYFVLKLILEAVLSSSAVLTEFYFGWDSGDVGWYLALLGLLVLPANAVVASLAQSYDDRELIAGMQLVLFIGCLALLQVHPIYHVAQYMVGTIILVVSANALEGPNMSLLSQTIPKSWSTGIFNVGLLSTEAGTFGRAMGNVVLTVFSSDGVEHLLNRAFGSFAVITMITLYITYYFYDYLEPLDLDD